MQEQEAGRPSANVVQCGRASLDQKDSWQREGCHTSDREVSEMERQSQEGSGKGQKGFGRTEMASVRRVNLKGRVKRKLRHPGFGPFIQQSSVKTAGCFLHPLHWLPMLASLRRRPPGLRSEALDWC